MCVCVCFLKNCQEVKRKPQLLSTREVLAVLEAAGDVPLAGWLGCQHYLANCYHLPFLLSSFFFFFWMNNNWLCRLAQFSASPRQILSLRQIICAHGWKAFSLWWQAEYEYFYCSWKRLPHDNHTSLCALRGATTWSPGIASGIFTKAATILLLSLLVGRTHCIKILKIWHINSFPPHVSLSSWVRVSFNKMHWKPSEGP